MERREIFVEIDGEEIEVADSVLEDCVVLAVCVEELGCCFCGDWTDLTVTSCVSWDEEDGYTIWLCQYIKRDIPPSIHPCFVLDIGRENILLRIGCVQCRNH
jgi:hypothetical protein